MSDEIPNQLPDQLPGRGLLGWLGRQFGYVKKAVKTDVENRKLYHNQTIEEQPHPTDPKVTLRRTTVDEAIANRKAN